MTQRFIMILLAAALSFHAPLSHAEEAPWQSVITHQMEALKHDDGPAAYGDAAPQIQQIFPNPEVFMGMVRGGYYPVYRNKDYSYGKAAPDASGRIAQEVIIEGTDGNTWIATYYMVQQPDGTWKVGGVSLEKQNNAV